MFLSPPYFDACKECDAKPAADKTWANFKLHFKEAQTRLDWQQCTSQQGGYHSANAALAAQATESVTQISSQVQTPSALPNALPYLKSPTSKPMQPPQPDPSTKKKCWKCNP
jgi:hypothetical protein